MPRRFGFTFLNRSASRRGMIAAAGASTRRRAAARSALAKVVFLQTRIFVVSIKRASSENEGISQESSIRRTVATGWLGTCHPGADGAGFARRPQRRCQQCRSLPFAESSFDLVFAFDVLEHVDDGRSMVRELLHVLRPGGAIAIHVAARPSL